MQIFMQNKAHGKILHAIPDGKQYPCYKVVNSKGHLARQYAFGGIEKQKEKLEADGIEVIDYKVDLNKYQQEVYLSAQLDYRKEVQNV